MASHTSKSLPNAASPPRLQTRHRDSSQTKMNEYPQPTERSPIAMTMNHSGDKLEGGDDKGLQLENAEKKKTTPTKSDDESTCCPICYEELPSDPANSNEQVCLKECKHIVCVDCLKSHCQHWIASKPKLEGIPCPRYAAGCTCQLTHGEVKRALHEPLIWKRYLKAVRWYRHPTWVSCWCPYCNELVEQPPTPTLNPSSSANNRVTCASCQRMFCKIHGKGHDIRLTSCEQYQRSTNEQLSRATLRKYCKPCSRCGCHISKESGCDHVICTACGDDMCYKCGTHEYLTGTSIRHCGKCRQGYLDHRYNCRHRAKALLALPLLLPFYFAYMIIMTIAAIVSFGFCCCCGCTAHLDRDTPAERTTWRAVQVGMFAIVLPFLFMASEFGFHFDLIDEITHGPAQNATQQQNMPDIPVLTMDDEEDEELEHMESGVQNNNPIRLGYLLTKLK